MVHYSIKPIENNLYRGTVFPDILIVNVSIVSDSQVHHSKWKHINHETLK